MWGKCQMLGYVKISKGRLTGNGYELYRGVYCSLCNALGRNYGPAARLLQKMQVPGKTHEAFFML